MLTLHPECSLAGRLAVLAAPELSLPFAFGFVSYGNCDIDKKDNFYNVDSLELRGHGKLRTLWPAKRCIYIGHFSTINMPYCPNDRSESKGCLEVGCRCMKKALSGDSKNTCSEQKWNKPVT